MPLPNQTQQQAQQAPFSTPPSLPSSKREEVGARPPTSPPLDFPKKSPGNEALEEGTNITVYHISERSLECWNIYETDLQNEREIGNGTDVQDAQHPQDGAEAEQENDKVWELGLKKLPSLNIFFHFFKSAFLLDDAITTQQLALNSTLPSSVSPKV